MWAHGISAVLGVYLMAAPAIFRYTGAAEINHRIVGPLVVSFGVIAIWEVTRSARFVNTLLGPWLILSAFILPQPLAAALSAGMCGLIISALSLIQGEQHPEHFGGGWVALWRNDG